ncbi:hypothetical protein [Dinghuibacter silviterrae]|uniref:hypothetical protein n=1 Tax=Dinghuibacter silviterrae TaxID=1539049 RepID=UPI0010639332|nr:hypothetical protein [Dinghuibacter silviterrae]
MDSIVGFLGLAVGIAGLVIAWFQYQSRLRLEHFTKASWKGMAGNIAKIQQSTEWAATNMRDAHNSAIRLPDSELKIELLGFISRGFGDATATDRLVTNLFNDVLNLQEAQFKTRIVTHPERDELKLYKMERDQRGTSGNENGAS